MAPEGNPVLDRVAVLLDQWLRFAEDSDYRLLVWQVEDRESRLVDAFIGLEGTESGLTPDLFIPFDVPFEGLERHGDALLDALAQLWEHDREELAGELPDPRAAALDRGIAGLMAALTAIIGGAPEPARHVVAVIRPKHIASTEDWTAWCRRWLEARPPERVRLLLVEAPGATGPAALASDGRRDVLVLRPDLRYADMVADAAAAVGNPGPGKDFNQRFVALMRAVEERRSDAVRSSASSALAIVDAQGWSALGVAVHVAVAAWHLQEGALGEADRAYQAAEGYADAATAAGDSTGPRLRAHAGIGRGVALLRSGRFEEAAPICVDAAERAEAVEDGYSSIEAWRLATLAYTRAGQAESALAAAERAFAGAAKMTIEDRSLTTLPYLGRQLLDELVVGHGEVLARARLADLLGSDWEARLG